MMIAPIAPLVKAVVLSAVLVGAQFGDRVRLHSTVVTFFVRL